MLEVKQACYAATGALQIAAGYLASGISPGAKALVIATDVAMVDARAGYAEPATGTGAAAMLLGDDPRILALDLGAFGATATRPWTRRGRCRTTTSPTSTARSSPTWTACPTASPTTAARSPTSTCGPLSTNSPCTPRSPAWSRPPTARLMRDRPGPPPMSSRRTSPRRVTPSLVYPGQVGNLCSGSVYLALASLIDNSPYQGTARVGLFSYGSGCASEFFSGLVDEGSRAALAELGIAGRLDARVPLSFAEYAELLTENSRCLVPVENRKIDVESYRRFLDARPGREPVLAYCGTEGYHRTYEWV